MIHPLYTLYSEDGGRFMMAAKVCNWRFERGRLPPNQHDCRCGRNVWATRRRTTFFPWIRSLQTVRAKTSWGSCGQTGYVRQTTSTSTRLKRFVWQSGSGYAIYDAGINPEKAVTDTAVRKELGILTFEYDKMGPGRMMCAVPRVSEAGRAIIFKPMDQSGGIEAAIEAKQTEKIMYLRNKVGDASAVQHKHAY